MSKAQGAQHAPQARRTPTYGGRVAASGGRASVQALQRAAGNRAVAAAVQRYAAPAKPVPITPAQDPRFRALTSRLDHASAAVAQHPPARSEAKKVADAAVPPAQDKEAQAQAAQAEQMSGAKPGGFDKAAFVAQVKAAVAAKAPKNLDEADTFGTSGKAGEVKSEVAAKVAEGKDGAARDIAHATDARPDPSRAVEKPVTPLAPAVEPTRPVVDAASAMPAKAPPSQTDLSGGRNATNEAMASAEVTEHQLATSHEPDFTGALADKRKGEQHSATAPPELRASESDRLADARQQAAGTAKDGVAAMLGVKQSMLSKGASEKSAAKAKDEQERARIVSQIQGIFAKTKSGVTAILEGLDAEVTRRFEGGEKAAREAFTADHTQRMTAYKDQRYSGLAGAGRWVRDKFASLPAEANTIYLEAKKVYEAKMEACISTVADFVGAELTRAKEKIAEGRAQIKDYVAQQPKNLQRFAGDTAGKLNEQFDQLESDVDGKKDALAEDLAAKYDESRKAVDAEIETMQAENKGWWDKAVGAIGGVVTTILQLKSMLLGVLARAANAVGRIIADPIGFLGNFVGAVKAGIINFASNIVEHLKAGLKGWLLGALAQGGIELPEKFDLPGIVKLVLSVLGLTWAGIRARIVKHIPEPIMDKVEKGVEIIQVLLKEGLGGLWRWVLEKVGDIKEMVMAQIQDFVITKIVKAGITWLISLLNPAAAFIKACKMIYDVVMFFVEKGSQIKEFVDSVLDSVESIAGGGVGAVAGLIEKTLARTLPLVLGFLASLLGLGGISEKIKSILETVQKPVMSVVDRVVGAAVKYGKKFMASAKSFGKKALGKVGKKLGLARDDSPEGKQKRLDQGTDAAVKVANRFAAKPVGSHILTPLLRVIRSRFGLTSLKLVAMGGNWGIEAQVNPRSTKRTRAKKEKTQGAKIEALKSWFANNGVNYSCLGQISITSELCKGLLRAKSASEVGQRLAMSRRYVRGEDSSASALEDERVRAYGDKPRPKKPGYREGREWHHLEQQSILRRNILGYNPLDDPTLDMAYLEHRKTLDPQKHQRARANHGASIGSAQELNEAHAIAAAGLRGQPGPSQSEDSLVTMAVLAHQAYLFSLTTPNEVGGAIREHERWLTEVDALASAAFSFISTSPK